MSVASESGESTNALSGKLTFEQSKDRIIGREVDNNPRLIILADGEQFVMKVAPAGVDVLTATDDEVVFNSGNNLFKIVRTGSVTFDSPNAAGTSTNASVEHDLGYVPIVMAFVSLSSLGTAFPMPYIVPDLTGTLGLVAAQISFEASDDNIIFFQRDLSRANIWTNYIRYYIVQETASVS